MGLFIEYHVGCLITESESHSWSLCSLNRRDTSRTQPRNSRTTLFYFSSSVKLIHFCTPWTWCLFMKQYMNISRFWFIFVSSFFFNTIGTYIIYIKGLIFLYVLLHSSCTSFCCVQYSYIIDIVMLILILDGLGRDLQSSLVSSMSVYIYIKESMMKVLMEPKK